MFSSPFPPFYSSSSFSSSCSCPFIFFRVFYVIINCEIIGAVIVIDASVILIYSAWVSVVFVFIVVVVIIVFVVVSVNVTVIFIVVVNVVVIKVVLSVDTCEVRLSIE